MLYEEGFLRYVKLGDHEVLRMIYFALRDHNWDTMSGIIEDEKISHSSDQFKVSYKWISNNSAFPFVWKVAIIGTPASEIFFRIDGECGADVQKNRTGFCVLHSPMENAGQPCTIIQPDGHVVDGKFPQWISPHQPFVNIASMQWPLIKNTAATLHFRGDIFEMEDQRNWTDDSYKTYCTPLALPFPVLLKKGDRVQQEIHLQINNAETFISHEVASEQVLTSGEIKRKLPHIGLSESTVSSELSAYEVKLLQRLRCNHYRIEFDLASVISKSAGWSTKLENCRKLGHQLEAILIFGPEPTWTKSLEKWMNLLREKEFVPQFISIFQNGHKSSPDTLIRTITPILRANFARSKIGAGSLAYFTELNRERVMHEMVDYVTYSINPQVHAFDEKSLTETLAAQAYTLKSARHYFPDREVMISPVSLKPRFNPNATQEETHVLDALPDNVDVRQNTLYAAQWTFGSLVHLINAGIDAVTYFETVGWKGFIQGDNPPDLPTLFPAQPKDIFPVFHLWEFIFMHEAIGWQPLLSDGPLDVKGLLIYGSDIHHLLLSNYQNSEVNISLDLDLLELELTFVTPQEINKSIHGEVNLLLQVMREIPPIHHDPRQVLTIPANCLVVGKCNA